MARQFPFFAAAGVTVVAGLVVTSVIPTAAAGGFAITGHPGGVGLRAGGPSMQVPPSQVPGNSANTPTAGQTTTSTSTSTSTTTTTTNTSANGTSFSPGNPNLNNGANAFNTVQQAAQYGQPGMNQPGQASFGETFISNQTWMNQPGQPDIYEGTYNPYITQANQGAVPAQAYPNPVSPATGVSATATRALGFAITQSPNTVGFYSGFGPGQADFGFYNGFTTPR